MIHEHEGENFNATQEIQEVDMNDQGPHYNGGTQVHQIENDINLIQTDEQS